MTINVYQVAPNTETETHDVCGVTVGEWFDSHGLCREKLEKFPPHVEKNGHLVPPEEWDAAYIDEGDTVDIWFQPNSGAFKALGSLVGGILGAVFGFLMPSQRSPSRRGSPEQGRRLEPSDARANAARMGDVVPELAGRHIRYPDYLNQPRRYFHNRREQWLQFLCCIGPGEYQIEDEDVRVGDTPFANLGDDGSYQIYGPNANLAGNPIHENWYSVDEVGGTSSGTAGLELVVERDRSEHTDPAEYVFEGNTITIPSGTGSFPPGWGPNTVVSVVTDITKEYAVTREGPALNQYNVFTGDFGHLMPIAEFSIINFVGGGVSGEYQARFVDLDAQGVGSMQLWTLGVPPTEDDPGVDPEPISGLAEGDYNLTTRTVRNVTITNVSEEVLVYSGTPLYEITNPATIRYESGPIYGEFSSIFAVCPAGELTQRFECDFFFPQGLGYIQDSGNIANRSVTVEIQHRDSAVGGAFTSVLKTFTDRTQDQIGFTEVFNVASSRPEVRIRRVGVNETSTQVLDTVQWYALRSRLPTVTRYPNWTTMAVRMRSGGRLSAQSENQVNVIATRKLPRLSGGEWTAPAPTRDVASFVKYIASTIGYGDDDLDMEELVRLDALWRSRGESLDHVFDETTVKQALDVALQAGMSELTVTDGRIRPVRDDVRTTFETEQGYSPQNMTRPLTREFTARSADDADGVEVEFMDSRTWEKNVVRCFLPGDQGFKIEKIKADGITDRTRAYRFGMRHRSMLRYRRWEYDFSTEMDAMNSEYLSYVPLLDDIPGYGQSSLLEGVEDRNGQALLHVSEPMRWEEGENHIVAYRRPDGTVAGPFSASLGDNEYRIIADMPKPWPVVTLKYELPHVYFGTSESWCFPALITGIRPQENGEQVRVQATNYDARVYAYDDAQPPQE